MFVYELGEIKGLGSGFRQKQRDQLILEPRQASGLPGDDALADQHRNPGDQGPLGIALGGNDAGVTARSQPRRKSLAGRSAC